MPILVSLTIQSRVDSTKFDPFNQLEALINVAS
uniref:Uncharacterized protein n=1 Tax=Arundo donax TaxID=35708 RepID=A0A0A9F5A5_ARUDO